MILEVREISIAVRDVEKASDTFRRLGFDPGPILDDPTPLVESRSASMRLPNTHLGVMSSLGDKTPISRFIDKRGEGFFSITLLVTRIEDVMEKWRAEGVEFVRDTPVEERDYLNVSRVRIPVLRVNWTRPSTLHGLCIELHEFRNYDGTPFHPKEA
jgi:hypothetical protein